MNMLTSSLTKSLAVVVLLVSLSASAMKIESDIVVAPDLVGVTPPDDIRTPDDIRKVVCPRPDTDTVIVNKPAVKSLWKNTCAYLSSKKAAIKETIVDLKARYKLGGIKLWTNKEKAAIVIGSATAIAATTYAIYKIYKACTTKKHEHKVTVRVQHNNNK